MIIPVVASTADVPNKKARSLQASLESTYICFPVFVPQITGGAGPPGLVTEKVSVKHWDATLQVPLSKKISIFYSRYSVR